MIIVNQLDGITEWLDSLLQLVTHVASLKSTQNVPEQCQLLRMRDTKLKILGCLDHSFKLPAALDWLQYLTNQIKVEYDCIIYYSMCPLFTSIN